VGGVRGCGGAVGGVFVWGGNENETRTGTRWSKKARLSEKQRSEREKETSSKLTSLQHQSLQRNPLHNLQPFLRLQTTPIDSNIQLPLQLQNLLQLLLRSRKGMNHSSLLLPVFGPRTEDIDEVSVGCSGVEEEREGVGGGEGELGEEVRFLEGGGGEMEAVVVWGQEIKGRRFRGKFFFFF